MISPSADESPRAGLCSSCVNSAIVRSDRGSIFYRCELSRSNPNFPKYPRLPVLECTGWRESQPMVYCPRCNERLAAERCKLLCKRCGYYMSCSDYY